MTEATEFHAKAIHRLLGVDPKVMQATVRIKPIVDKSRIGA